MNPETLHSQPWKTWYAASPNHDKPELHVVPYMAASNAQPENKNGRLDLSKPKAFAAPKK